LASYNHKVIDEKWQKYWYSNKTFRADDFSSKPKYYCLIEFPYPSGEGLHVGHPRSYTAIDILARKKRMEGYNVLFPIGWDAFGLPTENYAIKKKLHPNIITNQNIATYKRQLMALGFSFDWDREVNTTDPSYYRWTQWIFLKFFEKGLAYKDTIPINWCLSCKIGLANEEVVNGVCERCGGEVEKRNKEQWMLRITEYAQRLIDDLSSVNFLEKIKKQQENWIGRSEGAEIIFKIAGFKYTLEVFTTRPDTLFGATYMVLAPEHPLVGKITPDEYKDAVNAYIQKTRKKSEIERTDLAKEKTGVFTGAYVINPANGQTIPVWIADYVLISYGTGAIMAVPGHDQRDWEFAMEMSLPIVEVISGGDIKKEAYTGDGILVNSSFLNGKTVPQAIEAMTEWLEANKIGKKQIQYKLRDWVFSRQRYWGEPIPIIICPSCGFVPVPEDQLPLLLPDVEKYEPTETGESPLAAIEEWVNTTCPKCRKQAKRETDTMPNWAGSSWYFFRYIDPQNEQSFCEEKKLKYWMPIDIYNGGMEHTTLHLLYSRFWNKFLYDCKLVPTSEPYRRRTSHGMILGEGSEKMSKSRGNVINPDEIVKKYGADVFRCYEMFIGPFDQAAIWNTKGIEGIQRFLNRLWRLVVDEDNGTINKNISEESPDAELLSLIHYTIKFVTEHIDEMRYNTALAQMMTCVNELYKRDTIAKDSIKQLVLILSPFAPHLSEELWERLGEKPSILKSSWPEYDRKFLKQSSCTIAVSINGKVRSSIDVDIEIPEDELKSLVLDIDKIKHYTEGKKVVKMIVVPKKLVNIVVK
jgi:leucyl-tRNA synthetase